MALRLQQPRIHAVFDENAPLNTISAKENSAPLGSM